jgi:dipeptidyl aminopeptidase/acylaminoacyl peptidase
LVTVFYERDTASGEYALLDRQTRTVRSLFKQRKALDNVALRKMQSVIIPARDGLRLNGYLTLPSTEAGAGKLPMVLLIHGAPMPATNGVSIRPINGWQIGAMRC